MAAAPPICTRRGRNLSRSLVMATPDEGLALIAYAPCQVKTTVAGGIPVTVNETTDYPFNGEIQFSIELDSPCEFGFQLRIPAWADEATLTINDETTEIRAAGSFHEIRRAWRTGDSVGLRLPMDVRLSEGHRDLLSVHRGPLLFGSRIDEEWKQIAGELPHGDWGGLPAVGMELRLDTR